ncbi:MAG: SPOR domain-containing protein [Gammaproteobacteria bacterium]|nr:SPOR domain-containing protein [Gammaproteobacteria bacterium]
MRLLLLLLLLANAVVFAWFGLLNSTEEQLPGNRLPVDPGQPLVLLGEAATADDLAAPMEDDGAILAEAAGSDDQPAASDNTSGDTDSAATALEPAVAAAGDSEPVELNCALLGPLNEESSAELLVKRLLELGYVPELRSEGGQIKTGYWVHLPPFEDRDAAKDTEEQLRNRGVKDLFIVTGEENLNAISLGLFSSVERADQRAAEIGRLGFNPRISERFRDATVYTVRIRELPGADLTPEALGALGPGEILPEITPVNCEDDSVIGRDDGPAADAGSGQPGEPGSGGGQ